MPSGWLRMCILLRSALPSHSTGESWKRGGMTFVTDFASSRRSRLSPRWLSHRSRSGSARTRRSSASPTRFCCGRCRTRMLTGSRSSGSARRAWASSRTGFRPGSTWTSVPTTRSSATSPRRSAPASTSPGDGAPERIDGARVSSSLFPLFGAKAAAGRVFTADEDQPGKPPVVILSNGFWKRRFGSDPSVVGRGLTLNGTTVTIVGVMAADFVFNKEIMPAVNGIQNVDLLLPLPLNETARSEPRRGGLQRLRQLKPGVSVQQRRRT